ncbi:hypothetical protein [Latilactobacillus graminis]|uniref:Uncharacterized protein n=2 Tax=Latilactobacillus graminis TaxID=60519 RepID=A0AA89KWP5_9LACO|nr:hypothetical protein [Latilactobacillus graminis]KRM21208.1 hypothetical protein FC90_GL001745 [Latilactobacillus graminis DSM 20719]QFP79334.1 hypothetical protein LG542_03410 [Latilactobacillus graminis]
MPCFKTRIKQHHFIEVNFTNFDLSQFPKIGIYQEVRANVSLGFSVENEIAIRESVYFTILMSTILFPYKSDFAIGHELTDYRRIHFQPYYLAQRIIEQLMVTYPNEKELLNQPKIYYALMRTITLSGFLVEDNDDSGCNRLEQYCRDYPDFVLAFSQIINQVLAHNELFLDADQVLTMILIQSLPILNYYLPIKKYEKSLKIGIFQDSFLSVKYVIQEEIRRKTNIRIQFSSSFDTNQQYDLIITNRIFFESYTRSYSEKPPVFFIDFPLNTKMINHLVNKINQLSEELLHRDNDLASGD